MHLQCTPVVLQLFQPKRSSPTQRVSEQPRLNKVISMLPPQIPGGHHRGPLVPLYGRCATVHRICRTESSNSKMRAATMDYSCSVCSDYTPSRTMVWFHP